MRCVNCGDEIQSRNPRQKYCHAVKTLVCPTCHKTFTHVCDKHMSEFCSPRCASRSPERQRKIRETMMRNHGVSCVFNVPEVREKATEGAGTAEASEKRRRTSTERYGVDNPMRNKKISEKVRQTQTEKYGGFGFNTDRQKATMVERYGTEVPARNKDIAEKIRQTQTENHDGSFAFNTEKQSDTMIRRFGGKGRLSSPDEMRRQLDTMVERYGVRTPCEYTPFQEKAQNTLITRYGSIFQNAVISRMNKDFARKLQELGVETEFEKELDGRYFDIFIPDHNILIEINPTITHNSTIPFACTRNGCGNNDCHHKALSRDYHYNKSIIARNHDMTLIQKYDWDSDEDILAMIYEKIREDVRKYSARKLVLTRITQREANVFLRENHIQGGSSNQEFCYCLSDGDEIIAVSTFVRSRFNKNYEWEFCRYAVRKGIRVHGGHSRMFKKFVEDAEPSSVVSYVDFNHTTRRNVFLEQLGFVEDRDTGPTLVWNTLRGRPRKITQNAVNRLGADRILGTRHGTREESGMNNEQILLLEGFVKIFTAGNRVFSWYPEPA